MDQNLDKFNNFMTIIKECFYKFNLLIHLLFIIYYHNMFLIIMHSITYFSNTFKKRKLTNIQHHYNHLY